MMRLVRQIYAEAPRRAVRQPFVPPCRQMINCRHSRCYWRAALVIALIPLVHATTLPVLAPIDAAQARQAKSAAPAKKPEKTQRISNDALPLPVQEMRDLILGAVEAGDIDELRHALEWNELRPELGIERDKDAIEHFREASADGEGLEILARLADILALPPGKLPIGPDLENNTVYVWPYLAERKPKSLTPRERIDLFKTVPAAEAKAILDRDKWSWYRLAIGADGTWHIFSKSP